MANISFIGSLFATVVLPDMYTSGIEVLTAYTSVLVARDLKG